MEMPLNPENIENQIEQLLTELDNFRLEQFPAEKQDAITEEWYDVEMEARVGLNREKALKNLKNFVEKLKEGF